MDIPVCGNDERMEDLLAGDLAEIPISRNIPWSSSKVEVAPLLMQSAA